MHVLILKPMVKMSDAVMLTEWETAVVKHTCSFRLWRNWARRLGLKGWWFELVTEVGDNWGLQLTCESAPKHMQAGSTSKSTDLETFYSKNEPFRRQTLASLNIIRSFLWRTQHAVDFFFKYHISTKDDDDDVCSDKGLADPKLQLKWTKFTDLNGLHWL